MPSGGASVVFGRRHGTAAAAVAAAVLFAFAGSARATSSLVADGRSTSFSGEFGTSTQTPSSPFATFNAGTFAGWQNSTVSATQMDASGNGSVHPGAPTESGTSTFEIDFALAAPMRIILSGTLDLFDPLIAALDPGRAEFVLSDLDTPATLFSATTDGTHGYDAVLGPGNYRLRAFAAGGFDLGTQTGATYSLSASLLAVPEPSTGLLASIGLTALGVAGRRRR